MARKPKSVDGKRFAFMKRFDIRNDPNDPDKVYLRRWRVLQSPWASLYVHKIFLPDQDRDLHDHPWPFVSFILKGGYTEQVPAHVWPSGDPSFLAPHVLRHWKRFTFHRMRSTDFHSIVELDRVPTWSVMFVGPRVREWGFMTEDGWEGWQSYIKRRGLPEEQDAVFT